MTEKKTFKNPQRIVLDQGYEFPHWNLFGSVPEPEEAFGLNEWDVEVTFTKKRGPVESGQWREMGVIGEEVAVYVLAIYGSVAWVTDDPEDLEQGRTNAWTEPIASLR